jgi:hypothetical protein
MRPIRISLILLMAIAMAVAVVSCKKEKNDSKDNTTWASDNSLAEKTFGDVKNIADEAMATQGKSTSFDTIYLGPCVLVTLDLAVFPYELTIDFGTTNCLCNDGHYRRGRIVTTFTGLYHVTGTVITHTFDNYFVDDNQVLGTVVITNQGPNNAGHPIFSVEVNGSIIKANNGGTITWVSSRTNEWAAGYDTPQWWDDIYLITGTGTGTGTDGKIYTMEITSAVEVKLNCHWIVAGILEIQPQDYPLIIVDYGDGTCDATAVVTINGVDYTITMP